ncbi:MAG: hypothetical protein ABIQ57_00935 [Candidatus Kapaibacterium sp.]
MSKKLITPTPLLSPVDVAAQLGISDHTARELMRRGPEMGGIASRNIAATGYREQWRTLQRYIDEYLAAFGEHRIPVTSDDSVDSNVSEQADKAVLFNGSYRDFRNQQRQQAR